MEIFFETLSKFVDLKVKDGMKENKKELILLKNSIMGIEEISEKFNSNSVKFKSPGKMISDTSVREFLEERFLYIVPIALLLLCIPKIYHGQYFECSTHLIFAMGCYFLISLNTLNDWLHTWRLKLYHSLGRNSTTNTLNPRSIAIYHCTPLRSDYWIWSEFYKVIPMYYLAKIGSIEKVFFETHSISEWLFRFIYNATHSPTKETIILLIIGIPGAGILYEQTQFCKYLFSFLFFHFIFIYIFKKLPFLLAFLINIISAIFIVFLVYYSLEVGAMLCTIIVCEMHFSYINIIRHETAQNDRKFWGNDWEMIEKACQIHEALTNESIFFTVVSYNFVSLETTPRRCRKYIKFFIHPLEVCEIYHHIFDLFFLTLTDSEISLSITKDFTSKNSNLTKWVDASLRCLGSDASRFVADGLKFLSLFIETNNGVLPDEIILSIVAGQLSEFASKYSNRRYFENQSDFGDVQEFIAYLKQLKIV